jgi:hypothetical protein
MTLLSATSATITSPSITLTSLSGVGGGIYLGGYADILYFNGFPFADFFTSQW